LLTRRSWVGAPVSFFKFTSAGLKNTLRISTVVKPETNAISTSTHVLLIDDNPNDRDLCLRELRREHFSGEVVCAASYEETAQQLHHGKFDVIVCDNSLNGRNGLDVLRLVRESGLDTPFILLTGTLDNESAAECMRRGMASCVFKDHLWQLASNIKRVVQERRVREERERSEAAAREALAGSEARFRQVVDSNLLGIFFWNSQHVITEANEVFRATVNFSAEELCEGIVRWETLVPAEHRLRLNYFGATADVSPL
jgi:CheY-like chemotaxis protein